MHQDGTSMKCLTSHFSFKRVSHSWWRTWDLFVFCFFGHDHQRFEMVIQCSINKNVRRINGFREDWRFRVYEEEEKKFGDLNFFNTFLKILETILNLLIIIVICYLRSHMGYQLVTQHDISMIPWWQANRNEARDEPTWDSWFAILGTKKLIN